MGPKAQVWQAAGRLGVGAMIILAVVITVQSDRVTSPFLAFWNPPSGSRAHMVMPWNSFHSVFLVERQRGPKAIKEAQPKPKTLPVALPSMRAEVPMETRQSLEGHGPGLAQVPAPILHQSAHGPFGSPASLRPGLR